jgi:hypothetical protein
MLNLVIPSLSIPSLLLYWQWVSFSSTSTQPWRANEFLQYLPVCRRRKQRKILNYVQADWVSIICGIEQSTSLTETPRRSWNNTKPWKFPLSSEPCQLLSQFFLSLAAHSHTIYAIAHTEKPLSDRNFLKENVFSQLALQRLHIHHCERGGAQLAKERGFN